MSEAFGREGVHRKHREYLAMYPIVAELELAERQAAPEPRSPIRRTLRDTGRGAHRKHLVAELVHEDHGVVG